jgi:CMP-N-acetylneuraminic acid synthetase
MRSRVLLDDHVLYGADTRGVVMSREDSFDIDEAFDLKVAELLMASRPA